MPEFRVSQISDTHLTRCLRKLTENFQRVSERIDATRPDIIVNTGDLAFDAPTNRDDLAFAKALHDELPVACRYLPGNHDIGDNPTEFGPPSEPPVTEENRQYFVSVIGEDRWSFDAAGWRFIGLNSMVMNSGLACEAEQFDWLTSQLAATGSKPVALFLHKPLYLNTPDDLELAATSFRYVPKPARRRLIELLDAVDLRLVASGHIHQRRDFTRGHVRHIWAPPTGFIIPDVRQERIGIKEVGLVEYRFEPHGFDVSHVRAQGQIDIKSLSLPIWTAYHARKIYASYRRRTSRSENAH
ncbi:metallophosphoesterase [Bradyrhizobium sp. KBS0727]|uniref:metallophosphoesterase family protein n=1 Tax=unclassified Bradyrhizobium TaxID=2631580 RepID=UPI00110D4FF4|nr:MULTISPECIES: metallophosphoesterase [unclassified Bradyrhizobium]QDW39361.1 metallophosphoesterase [Bradyrhizobium sp. KBS0725]QDW45964.1 metallophosphoesterase [Bradyrhizobium sp. KBS0727]